MEFLLRDVNPEKNPLYLGSIKLDPMDLDRKTTENWSKFRTVVRSHPRKRDGYWVYKNL